MPAARRSAVGMLQVAFGARVRIRRQAMPGMSQARLGRLIGRSRSLMNKIEKGHVRVTAELAAQIAEVLKTSIDALFGRFDQLSPDAIDLGLLYDRLPSEHARTRLRAMAEALQASRRI